MKNVKEGNIACGDAGVTRPAVIRTFWRLYAGHRRALAAAAAIGIVATVLMVLSVVLGRVLRAQRPRPHGRGPDRQRRAPLIAAG